MCARYPLAEPASLDDSCWSATISILSWNIDVIVTELIVLSTCILAFSLDDLTPSVSFLVFSSYSVTEAAKPSQPDVLDPS